MAERTYLYHKDYAPNGRIFDMEQTSQALLVEQGWVDHPGKFGRNIWGGSHELMSPIKHAFEAGKLSAIGDVVLRTENEERRHVARQLTEAHRSMRVQEDEIERLQRELREANEKLEDHRSDARKIDQMTGATSVARTKRGPVKVAANPAQPKRGAGAPKQANEPPPAGSITDL